MCSSDLNSDGSQFFVTVAPYTSGNNTYSIFGRVVSGSNVVYAINHVVTDANNKPLTNVVMQQVNIRRVGTAAQAFSITAQGLPIVTNLPMKIATTASQVTLTFTNRQYADNRLYSATNLAGAWSSNALGIEISAPVSNSVQQAKAAPRQFYAMAQIQYASSTFAPKTMYGRTLALTLTAGGSGTTTVTFDTVGGGTFIFPPNPGGSVDGYLWTQEPYRGQLLIGLSGYPVLDLMCNFTAGVNGVFTGTAYPDYPNSDGAFGVAGTFNLSGH